MVYQNPVVLHTALKHTYLHVPGSLTIQILLFEASPMLFEFDPTSPQLRRDCGHL